MRVLMGLDELDQRRNELDHREDLTDADLVELYAAPTTQWLRVNMVSTVDGSATGDSANSGSINNDPDKRIFHILRAMADVIIVGAGTARAERYGPGDTPIVLVSRHAEVPEKLRGAPAGSVLMATFSNAESLEEAHDLLGSDNVLVLGSHSVDLAALKVALVDRGFTNLLSEGGPHLLRDLVAQRVVDELTSTVVPRLVAGIHPRITDGPPIDVRVALRLLLEENGTLLGRWFI